MSNKIEVGRKLLEDFLNHRDNGDWYDGVWITHLDALRALLAEQPDSLTDEGNKPTAQHQGEPVAWVTVYRKPDSKDRIEYGEEVRTRDRAAITWGWSVSREPLYFRAAEQPAPPASTK